MRQLNRWLAVLLVVIAPIAALAQSGGSPEQIRNPGHDNVASDDSSGSALPRFHGGVERQSRPQRVILVMLITLVTATIIFGIGTVAYAFRDQWAHPRRH